MTLIDCCHQWHSLIKWQALRARNILQYNLDDIEPKPDWTMAWDRHSVSEEADEPN